MMLVALETLTDMWEHTTMTTGHKQGADILAKIKFDETKAWTFICVPSRADTGSLIQRITQNPFVLQLW